MLLNNKNQLNYLYKINILGEVCSFFDLTFLTFHLLLPLRATPLLSSNEVVDWTHLTSFRMMFKDSSYLFTKEKAFFFLSFLKDFLSSSVNFSNIWSFSFYPNKLNDNTTFLLLNNIFFNLS